MNLADLFPHHEVSLSLTHNEYKNYYLSIEDAVKEIDTGQFWVSSDERTFALATGDIWEMQWYPRTPIGFYKLAASSLHAVLNAAQQLAD